MNFLLFHLLKKATISSLKQAKFTVLSCAINSSWKHNAFFPPLLLPKWKRLSGKMQFFSSYNKLQNIQFVPSPLHLKSSALYSVVIYNSFKLCPFFTWRNTASASACDLTAVAKHTLIHWTCQTSTSEYSCFASQTANKHRMLKKKKKVWWKTQALVSSTLRQQKHISD